MKHILIAVLISLAFFGHAQKGNNAISVGYGRGEGHMRPIFGTLKGGENNEKSPINIFGLNYNFGINKLGIFETGVLFLKHNYLSSSSTPYLSGSQTIQSKKTLSALVLPFKLRFDVLKYFFVSGGPFIDVDVSKELRPSLGAGIGIGAQYFFENKYGLFIYPQMNIHTLSIGLVERHIAFGLTYRITKPKN